MSGSLNKKRFVIDTNVIFMSLYDVNGKASSIIELANKEKIELFSPESVKEELFRVLKREMDFSDEEVLFLIGVLPITWIKKEFYNEFLDKTKVKHKADKPVEAVSLMLDCRILSADHDFKERVDINKLLRELRC